MDRSKNKKRTRRSFTTAFKADAARLCRVEGRNIPDVAPFRTYDPQTYESVVIGVASFRFRPLWVVRPRHFAPHFPQTRSPERTNGEFRFDALNSSAVTPPRLAVSLCAHSNNSGVYTCAIWNGWRRNPT